MKTICECGEGATRNVRFKDGIPTFTGEQVKIDGEGDITYVSMCRNCRKKLVKKLHQNKHEVCFFKTSDFHIMLKDSELK